MGKISRGWAGLAGSSQTNDSEQNRPSEKKASIWPKAKDSWVEFVLYFCYKRLPIYN